MDTISERLIPYQDQDDLRQRVTALFNWEASGDPFIVPRLSANPALPQGVLLAYPHNSIGFDYCPEEEIRDLARQLPESHEIVQEILRQAKNNLEEIIGKSRDELRVRVPRYLNSLITIGGSGRYAGLFDYVQSAAYHIVNARPLTDEQPPQEARIVWAATESMLGYRQSEGVKKEVKKYLDHLWEKKVTLPLVVRGYADLGEAKAIDVYFELFQAAQGEKVFVLDEIQRGFNFKFIGRSLRRAFPDFNPKDFYPLVEEKLRMKLDSIFA